MVAMKHNSFVKLALLIALFAASFSPAFSAQIPVTGNTPSAPQIAPVAAAARPLATAIYDAGVFDYPIVQQPAGQPGFVSTEKASVTAFRMASNYGSQGFLAHNTLAGALFFNVKMGDTITVRYADGSVETFEVTQIRHLQATRPNSPTSSFVDLDNKNVTMTAVDLFYQTYGVKDTLILQTCIASGGVDSWGRLFIIATPVEAAPGGPLAQ
jgi:hypothetical protein